MITINDLNLKDTKSTDCPHLLLWDNPNNFEIKQLLFNNNAQLISYRENLLSRIKPQQKFLILHEKLDQELETIKQICRDATKSIVLLKDLDYLITYLYSIPNAPISLFWNKLANMRHLERILWIILPTKLKPSHWQENRIKTIM
jgi:hypothetical protein